MHPLVKVRQTCRLCESRNIVCSVPLAQVPIASPNVGVESDDQGRRLTSIVAPLDSYLCQDCGLIQLIHVVDPTLIYGQYLYRTSVSLGLAEHFRKLSETVISRLDLKRGDLVVEFGSNDGTLLSYFRDAGMRVQGVDPAEQIAREATAKGVPTRADFFNGTVARAIRTELGTARAIIANNAMANIDDLAVILDGVRELLAPDGVFVFETQYALDVFEKTLLDVIYHEHISTFSVRPVARTFPRHGLKILDAERLPTKGGSIRFFIQRDDGPWPLSGQPAELELLEQSTGLYDLAYHRRFSERITQIKRELHERIDRVRAQGGSVAAYGTSVGCAALIHQFELQQRLDCLFDDTPFKDRLHGPGYDLPILGPTALLDQNPAIVIILAWRYADPIMRKHPRYLERGGEFVVPLPAVRVFLQQDSGQGAHP